MDFGKSIITNSETFVANRLLNFGTGLESIEQNGRGAGPLQKNRGLRPKYCVANSETFVANRLQNIGAGLIQ